jgi:hypothetical protein
MDDSLELIELSSIHLLFILFAAALDNPLAISREMEKQITSNNIRIAMLEAQNKKLRHSIEKLSEIQEDVKPLRQVKIRCFSPLPVEFDSWNMQLSDNFTSCFHMFPCWNSRGCCSETDRAIQYK